MNDEDDTWRKTKRPDSHWNDDRRALESSERRRGGTQTPIQAAPVDLDLDDMTPVFDMLDRDPTEDERGQVARIQRDSTAPVQVVDLVKLLTHVDKRIERLSKREASNNEERANQLLDLLNRPPDEETKKLQVRIDGLEVHVAYHRRLLRWVGIAALGALTAVGSFIYTRGLTEGADKVRLEHLERAIDELRVRALDRRSDITPLSPAIAPDAVSSASTKDHP